jgi:hypothetical protein
MRHIHNPLVDYRCLSCICDVFTDSPSYSPSSRSFLIAFNDYYGCVRIPLHTRRLKELWKETTDAWYEFLSRQRKTTNILGHASWCSDRVSNPEHMPGTFKVGGMTYIACVSGRWTHGVYTEQGPREERRWIHYTHQTHLNHIKLSDIRSASTK